MRIRVDILRDNLCFVETRPNLLDWLLGEYARERFATRDRRGEWIWDVSGVVVEECVRRAICRAMADAHIVGEIA